MDYPKVQLTRFIYFTPLAQHNRVRIISEILSVIRNLFLMKKLCLNNPRQVKLCLAIQILFGKTYL